MGAPTRMLMPGEEWGLHASAYLLAALTRSASEAWHTTHLWRGQTKSWAQAE